MYAHILLIYAFIIIYLLKLFKHYILLLVQIASHIVIYFLFPIRTFFIIFMCIYSVNILINCNLKRISINFYSISN